MSGLAYIGPVAIELFNPSFSWASAPSAAGTRQASINGLVDWTVGHQLSELVANPARNLTVGADTGVLEYLWSTDSLLRAFNGWCLLRQCTISPDRTHSFGGTNAVVPVSLAVTHLGEHQPAVVRSSRGRANAHSLPPFELVAAPFANASTTSFALEPGGDQVLRDFDGAHGAGLGPAGDARIMDLRWSAVGTLPPVVLVALENDDVVPQWVSQRGGDCRVFDLAEGRDVYGPHPFAEPSDIMLCNGVTRWWVGPRGLAPYLTVSAVADGDWRQCGHVALADFAGDSVLEGARLVTVTPDRVTVALRLRTIGEVFVSLHRGEQMIRVQHGTTRAPAVSTARRVQWVGTPPAVGTEGPTPAAAEMGAGLDATDDIGFKVPPAVTQQAWSIAETWIPPDASTGQAASGVAALVDADGQHVVVVWYDDSDQCLRVGNGVGVVVCGPLVFGAGEPVRFVASFDSVDGLALTCRTPAGTTSGSDPSIVDAWSDSELTEIRFSVHTPWGALDWGDGVWGGQLAAAGAVDELLLFAGRVSDADATAIVQRVGQLDETPSTPRPVWYAAFDSPIFPTAAAVASGRRVESAADPHGLKRVVGALVAVSDAGELGIAATGESVEFMAALSSSTTVGSGNTAAEMHDQFAAYSEQETRIR